MKISLFLITIVGCVLIFSTKAAACSCELPRHESIKQQVKKAKKDSLAVFTGTVEKITQRDFGKIVTLRLERSWKGVTSMIVEMNTGLGGGDCGYDFEVGGSYLIYAHGKADALSTNICSRTTPSASAQSEMKMLGKTIKIAFELLHE